MRRTVLHLLGVTLAAAVAAGCTLPPDTGPPDTAQPCGNGVLDPGEECDDADLEDTDDCTSECRLNVCGDRLVRTDPANPADREDCDNLGVNTEECDSDCTLVMCGDAHENVFAGERCDDGNNIGGDGCRADCLSDETCGNGIVDDHLPNTRPQPQCMSATSPNTGCAEVCDDGNRVSGDGCSENCLSEETCPNGIVDIHGNGTTNGPEVCDDGNLIDDDACPSDCHAH